MQELCGQDVCDFNRTSFQDSDVFNRTSVQVFCGPQENPDFERILLQDFCGHDNSDFYRTSFQDLCGQDTSAFHSTFSQDQMHDERGTQGVAFKQPVYSLVSSSAFSQDNRELLSRDCNVNHSNSSVFVGGTNGDFGLAMVRLHERVFSSGLPNYKGLRIPLVSNLNIAQWRSYLSDYHDNVIVDYLEFGWPVGYDYQTYGFPATQLRNSCRCYKLSGRISHLS